MLDYLGPLGRYGLHLMEGLSMLGILLALIVGGLVSTFALLCYCVYIAYSGKAYECDDNDCDCK